MPRLDVRALTQPERLAALQHIPTMSTSISTLDGAAHLLARAADCPMALLIHIDGPQVRLVGQHGFAASRAALAMAAEVHHHLDGGGERLVVRDLRKDSATELAMTEQLGVIACLGELVRDDRGAPVAAACVADTVPRRWSETDASTVREAADLVRTTLVDTAPRTNVETDAVLDHALEAFVSINLTGEIVHWNPAAERTFGWSAQEAIGRQVDELIVPMRFREAHRAGCARVAAGGIPRLAGQRLQMSALHRDGHEFPIELTLNTSPGGAAHAFLYDISDRVAAQQDLDRERRFLETLLDSLDVGVVACDEDGRLVVSNQTMQTLMGGANPDLALWFSQHDVRHPDGTPMRTEEFPLIRALGGECIQETDITVHRPGERGRMFMANARQIKDASGARLGAVMAMHEMTDRRRAQRFMECELAVSRALDGSPSVEEAGRAVIEAVATTLRWPHGELWLVDPMANVLNNVAHWTDPRYQLHDFLPGALRPGEGMSGRAWLENRPIWIPDISIQPNRMSRWALAEQGLKVGLAVPIRDDSGVSGALTFFGAAAEPPEDSLIALLSGIAAHVGQFFERRRARALAQELSRTKDEFIALVGHEMRTPLTSISSYTELLLDGDLPAETRDAFLSVIARNAETLRAIIDDLLDLAGLESGYVTMHDRGMDLAAIVREVVQESMPAAAEKRLTLELDTPDQPVSINGDPPRLRKVVDHLVNNAIKYTPADGRVQVSLREDGTRATLCVADTGIGIPAEERQRLFQRFFRGSNARNKGLPGTGLGLAISRTVIERHGGTIAVTSNDEPPGTTFTMHLPLAPEAV